MLKGLLWFTERALQHPAFRRRSSYQSLLIRVSTVPERVEKLSSFRTVHDGE
jgi:hypothetical protein